MAYLKPQTPLKDLNSGDYFYPLTTIDQIITGNNRLSAFMSEDNNLLNLNNIGNLSANGNITGNNGIFSNHLTIGSSTLNTSYKLYVNGTSYFTNQLKMQYSTPNLIIKNTNASGYGIIRLLNSDVDDGVIMFLNGPSRADDGGANMFTIRNNRGNIRLDDNTIITGLLKCNNRVEITPGSNAPPLLIQTSAGTWSYIRMHNGSNYWDIASNTSSQSGALDFRPNGSDNMGPHILTNGMMEFANINASSYNYDSAAIWIRENNFSGSGSDTWGQAPRLGWHWRGRVAAQIGLGSNGWLYEAPATATNFYKIVCENGGTWDITATNATYINYKSQWVDLSSLNQNTYYPVTGDSLPYDGYHMIKVSVQLNSGTVPSWSTHGAGFTVNLLLYTTASGWGTTASETIVLDDYYGFANAKPVSYTQNGYSSTPVLWMRGGGKYRVWTDYNCTWTVRTSTYYTYNSGGYTQTVAPQSSLPSISVNGVIRAGAVYGAVWNDYAEMRNIPEANKFREKENIHDIKLAGRCVCEKGNDMMVLTDKRMQPGCKIISDTFGFNIGETEKCKTPVAVSGRVLAYIYEGREAAKNAIGKPVCSGPNGTVSIMTDEEYRNKGYCCVGIISAVPDYEVWGTGNVKVNGRIWVYVR